MSPQTTPILLAGQRVTVVGAGRSGLAASRLLSRAGFIVFLTEMDQLSSEAGHVLRAARVGFEVGGHTARALETDFVVTSPGVPSSSPLLRQAMESGIPVYSEIEAAFWFCRSPVVAITGSNGKTTTTALIGHIFRSSGRKTWVAGNIGHPFSDVVEKAGSKDVIILEISSFQLDHIDLFRPDVSVLLNITPDHLDRYGNSIEAYAGSKFRIAENQKDNDALVYNMDDYRISSWAGRMHSEDGPNRYGFTLKENDRASGFILDDSLILRTDENEEVLMKMDELALPGRHNVYNSLAAAVAARVKEVRSDIVRESLASFEGVPHRLEFVREVDCVQYVNDSKATNVNALWYALQSFSCPIVLIAGGRDKGNDYEMLAELVSDKVKAIICLGKDNKKIHEAFNDIIEDIVDARSAADAVNLAYQLSEKGDTVLLSPACASFDLFDNYEDRGHQFKKA
ncbi:MAG: UDP-N-acetylmuramoyl-L-alanine--D-glutamate ligase, partial [Bacteroidetes bacterium]|nr:UDP-N-acetylmuramoyl-L-alanine--D-glutamate ligase [Bacteroidota bacterium]